MGRFFNAVVETKVKGSRPLFILNHSKMFKLQKVVVKTLFSPTENFPPGHSLFMPCYNFMGGKTHGYLIALKGADNDKYRLGVLQHVEVKEDMTKIAYILVFKEGTSWSLINNLKNSRIKSEHSKLMSYLIAETLINPHVIPLVEISMRDSTGSPAMHMHLEKKGKCFEQPASPTFFFSLSHFDFKQMFNANKHVCYVGMNKNTHFFKTKRIVNVNVNDRKRKVTVVDDECFDLVKQTAKAMTGCKLMDRDDVDDFFHIYYVQYQQKYQQEDTPTSKKDEEKHFLFPVICDDGGYNDKGSVTFSHVVSNKENNCNIMNLGCVSVEEYNANVTVLCNGKTTKSLLIDPSKHKRGFVFSIVSSVNESHGTEVFRNNKVAIYHQENKKILIDSEIDGVVVFRGFPWFYNNADLSNEHMRCLDLMHDKSSGMLESRKKVDMVGYFSYTGPRATCQSSRTPIEPITKGHDLYNKNYCPLTYPLGVRLGRMLCRQSDEMLSGTGNVMMIAAIIAKDHYPKKNDDKSSSDSKHNSGNQLNYESICHNRIITKWFGSTLHRDSNDKVLEEIAGILDDSCEKHARNETDLSIEERKIFQYFQRTRALFVNEISMATICCWKALKHSTQLGCEEKHDHYIHFFCCESLGFALDISSICLTHPALNGSFGGSFSSCIINHGTSVPLSICSSSQHGVRLSVQPQTGHFIPFAWGRTGGSKKSS